MWILPIEASAIAITLPPGQHLLPWYYTDRDIDALAWLLRSALKGVRHELRVDDGTLRIAARRRLLARESLIIARIRDAAFDPAEALQCLQAMHGSYALLQLPQPQESGYGWLEQHVKVPLIGALRALVRGPAHPLAGINIAALPILEAAALTTEPIELLDLLERTVAHRMQHADVGIEEDDYVRSLQVCAGRRLAERLSELSGDSLKAALEIVLRGGVDLVDKPRLRPGIDGLHKIGLVRVAGSDVSLGPLARGVSDPRLHGALESALPKEAWSDESRKAAKDLRRGHELPSVDLPVAFSGEPSFAGSVPLQVDLLHAPVTGVFAEQPAATEALELLRDLSDLSSFRRELPPELKDRLVQTLRWLDDASRAVGTEERAMGQFLEGLLRMFGARGDDAIAQQEKSLRLLDDASANLPEVWSAPLRAAATLHHAGFLIDQPRSGRDLERADILVSECIERWGRETQEDPAHLAMAYLRRADIAFLRGEYEHAHEWDERALQSATKAAVRGVMTDTRWALARDALYMRQYEAAAEHASEALRVYESSGNLRKAEACRRILATTMWQRGDSSGGRVLLERSTENLKSIGDVVGLVETLLVLAELALEQRELEQADALAREALMMSSGEPMSLQRARVYQFLANVSVLNVAFDEAVDLFKSAAAIYDRLGLSAIVRQLHDDIDMLRRMGVVSRAGRKSIKTDLLGEVVRSGMKTQKR